MLVQVAVAFVGNCLLEVGQDLGAIRVLAQLRLRAIEIGTDRVEGVLVELVRPAVQIDRDDFVRGYRPSWLIVVLISFQ